MDLTYKERSYNQQVYVVEGLQKNLLGLAATTSLSLATQVEEVSFTGSDVHKRFPRVFEGLGKIGEEYDIKLKPEVMPFSLFTPHHVPLPLQTKVTEELACMKAMGIISKFDQPTPWCTGIVVVPKKSGSICICVGLKPLKKSVLREVHPLPRVDDILAQLSRARIFSKLDENSGFWQISLSTTSRLLTTFITPSGRYCFNKLHVPFRILCATELFQKRMGKILIGLEGIVYASSMMSWYLDEIRKNTTPDSWPY